MLRSLFCFQNSGKLATVYSSQCGINSVLVCLFCEVQKQWHSVSDLRHSVSVIIFPSVVALEDLLWMCFLCFSLVRWHTKAGQDIKVQIRFWVLKKEKNVGNVIGWVLSFVLFRHQLYSFKEINLKTICDIQAWNLKL